MAVAASRILAGNAAGIAFAASTDYYLSPFTHALRLNTTEANGTITFRSAGTISNFRVRVVSGNRSSTSPGVHVRKNGSDTAMGVDFAPGGSPISAGEYVDNSNTVSVSAGDTITIHGAGGGSGNANWTITLLGFDFTPSAGTVTLLGAASAGLSPTLNTTTYVVPGSDLTASATQAEGEWQVKLPSGVSGLVLRNLYVRVSADTIGTSDWTISVNGATGSGTAPSVSAHNGGAATYEDTSNSKIINDGDKISFKVVLPNTSGALTIQEICVEVYDATYGTYFLVAGSAAGVNYGSNNNSHPLGGSIANNATESRSQATISVAGVMQLLTAYVKTTNTVTIFLRAGAANAGSPSAVQVALSGGAGWKLDSSNTYSASASDLMNYRFSRTTTATCTCVAITVKGPITETATLTADALTAIPTKTFLPTKILTPTALTSVATKVTLPTKVLITDVLVATASKVFQAIKTLLSQAVSVASVDLEGITGATQLELSTSASASAATTNAVTKAYAATANGIGSIVNLPSRIVAAVAPSSAVVVRSPLTSVKALLTASAATVNSPQKVFDSSVTAITTKIASVMKLFLGGGEATAVTIRGVSMDVETSATASAVLTRVVAKVSSVASSAIATTQRAISKIFGSSAEADAEFLTAGSGSATLSTSVTASASIISSVNRYFTNSISAIASFSSDLSRTFMSTVTSSTNLSLMPSIVLNAITSASAKLLLPITRAFRLIGLLFGRYKGSALNRFEGVLHLSTQATLNRRVTSFRRYWGRND